MYKLVLFFVNFLSIIIACSVASPNAKTIHFAFNYFRQRNVTRITALICWNSDDFELFKKFSMSKMYTNRVNLSNTDAATLVDQLTSKYVKLGVLLDMKCDKSDIPLKIANENDLFIQSKSLTFWLILMKENVPQEILEAKAESYRPPVSDPVKYLLEPYHDTNNSDLLSKINKNFNADFIREYRRGRKKTRPEMQPVDPTGFDALLSLNALFDNEIVIAVPGRTDPYELYRMVKVTKESKVSVFRCGTVIDAGEEVEIKWRMKIRGRKKKSLQGELLTSVTAIYSLNKFTGMDDLRTRDTDAWSKMTYTLMKLLKDDLNFSVVIRFFDDYGWFKNGTFNGLMGYLQMRKADFSSAGLLFRTERYPFVDYLDSPFRLQTGIVFREPSLSSVTNIFLLPFDPTVWFCILGLAFFIVLVLKCEATVGKRLNWLHAQPNLCEILFFILAAVTQQGYHRTPGSNTGRITFLLLLLSCLALFTAFSAKIVAVMQSFSTSILSIEDITNSNFDVGIQTNFPIFDVALQEAIPVHKVIREFYYKKIRNRKQQVYFDPKPGIEKIRRGLFAYEVELTVGYKLISDTYEEIDKCGLKEVDVFPKPHLGTGLKKHSQFRETFVQRLRWNAEVGLITREWKRWIPQKPKCEAERIGFLSVGFNESYPAIMIFIYGFATSLFLLPLELIIHKLAIRSHSTRNITICFGKRLQAKSSSC